MYLTEKKGKKSRINELASFYDLFRPCKLLIACTVLDIQLLFVSGTRRRRDIKIPLCLSAP